MTYFIYIDDKYFEVSGIITAYEAFQEARASGARVLLVDGETGEVIADSDEDE